MIKYQKILWFTWKDLKHPKAGGAEAVNEQVAQKLVQNGYRVIFIVGGFPNCLKEEIINGYKVIRLGNRWTVYLKAYFYYRKNMRGWADLVIDEMNTLPFFCKFYVKEKNILLAYQLCREIWFYQMFFPLNVFGYLFELFYLRFLNDRYVLTESESTKIDLQKYGYQKNKIFVFPIGLEIKPLTESDFIKQKKSSSPTLLYLGSIRGMKRPGEVLEAFEIAKKYVKDLKFWVAGAGEGRYALKFFKQIKNSRYKNDIIYHGRVSREKKMELMRMAHLIAVTSVKEGWGIIVTEASSQGTPAVVYDADGLRDSVKHNETGLVCEKNTPENLARHIVYLLGAQDSPYFRLRENAWKLSHEMTLENSYKKFINILEKKL